MRDDQCSLPCQFILCNYSCKETLIDRKRAAERLLAALSELPEAQREAFLLQQEGDLSVEEIGAVTGVSRETAKSRLRYALAKLRASLETPS